MKIISKLLLLSMVLTIIMSCSDDDDITVVAPDGDDTIAQIVEENPEFSNLFAALEAADLLDAFAGENESTLFAPSNAAFTQFLELNGFASLGSVPEDELRQLLLNHVLEGTNLAADFSTGYIPSSIVGSASEENLSLFVNADGGVVINGVAEVTNGDVIASNGVIHIVNNVIGIPSVATQAAANPEFSSLVNALELAESEDLNFIQLLSGSGENSPYTVFAPTNAAFENLLGILGAENLDELDSETLATVLSYHVIPGNNVRSSDLSTGITAETFQGESLEFDLSDGAQIIDASGTNANIVETDVQTNNGVIHAVDKVLLPQEIIDMIDPTITGVASMNSDLSSLVEALEYTGLDEILANRSEDFTVFAPTNEAFDTFLDGAEVTELPVETVEQVLLNHVLSGISFSDDLETDYTTSLATYGETENNLSFYINTNDGVVLNGISTVTTPNVEAANGVVHIVDRVIDLPTVVTFVEADPNFESLLGALTDSGQSAENYVDLLSTPNGTDPTPFTVFAPSNQAFSDLFIELGVTGLDEIDPALLTSALNTHVVSGFNRRSEDLTDGTINTLGSDIIINTTDASITDPRGRLSSIVSFDVQAANGVVHAIDTVLLPEEE
ncbi:fasciclin domain-containing protein [Psychroflexus montanilacus]|uniref:fasciclin domain-containing protein n=1 Tax=Psychroflexus montanilacus TaxID=2873598 RepID=UPI001CCDFEBD|nr:fasciclin domain-containing protein [Psychroflexus montanilacus]MBZ9651636.1 fasciclin domain-containing protein [Psychroflexus montanilacus]